MRKWRVAFSYGRRDDKPDWLGELSFIARIGRDALEAVGFIAPGDFSLAQTDHRKTFWKRETRPMPPIAANRATTRIPAILVVHQFVDVEMALEDGEHIASF